jgi:hypothetical protein
MPKTEGRTIQNRELTMSHLTHIRTTIKNAEVLESVLRKMIEDGLENILVGATLEKNVTTHCFENYKTIDFVIHRPQAKSRWNDSSDFGFVKLEDEFKFLNYAGANHHAEKFMRTLTFNYARENALNSLAANGFNIESISEENGEIKIIAGKWS